MRLDNKHLILAYELTEYLKNQLEYENGRKNEFYHNNNNREKEREVFNFLSDSGICCIVGSVDNYNGIVLNYYHQRVYALHHSLKTLYEIILKNSLDRVNILPNFDKEQSEQIYNKIIRIDKYDLMDYKRNFFRFALSHTFYYDLEFIIMTFINVDKLILNDNHIETIIDGV